MIRVWLAGTAVVVLGAAGLVRGAISPAGPTASASSAPAIVVSDAFVRAPAPPTDAVAAYFTVTNNSATPDRLKSVLSGAGATTMLHSAGMRPEPNGVAIPAHGRLVLSTGKGHVMIEHLFGHLKAGSNVNLELTFQRAGEIGVDAPVLALGADPSTATLGHS